MIYEIEWKENAIKDLKKLEISISNRIYKKVDELIENPLSKDIKKLKGMNAFRLRVGDYRIIFEIEKDIICVLKVGHRKDVYKR